RCLRARTPSGARVVGPGRVGGGCGSGRGGLPAAPGADRVLRRPGGPPAPGGALYALGELEVAGVEATLDRFVTAQEPVVAGGAWSSLAYQKRREVLPQLLERVATAPDEWTHDQALKTVRLLADVQTRYYQVPWSDDAGWL